MKVIGLTGNIASGKSVVASMLAERGAVIIDSDMLSREVVTHGSPALDAIVARWGDGVLGPDGALDRSALRKIVFNDRAELDALNEIIHPEIMRLRNSGVEAARRNGERLVVCVVPLLFERHLAEEFDFIVLVDAPRAARLERIVRERGLAESDAMEMIAAQMPADLKRARADWVIENVGTRDELEAEVERLWEELEKDGTPSSLSGSSIP